MNLGSRIKSAWAGLMTGKSFASAVAAWKTGADADSDMATHLTKPYAQSSWVFSAINLVSGEFTGLPVKFYQGDQEYDDAAFSAWWSAPALGPDGKRLTRAEVDRLLALWLQLEGEFFILLDDSWMITAGRRGVAMSPFIIARPDRVRLVILAGELQGYVYTDAAGRQHVFVPQQVIHKKEPNPYDDWRGLGRAKVAAVPTEGAFLTGVYIRDLMRNNGDQGYIVVGKSGVATDEQRAQITETLLAKRRALRLGIAKDIFLGGDITIERKKEEAASVDLTNTKNLSHQEIYVAFGVPPSMSTVKAAYSIGKDSDRYQLITGTSQPLARTICGAYDELAQRQTGRALQAEHEWDDHPVMQEVRNSRIEAALKLWDKGWPWKVINDYLGLGMKPFPGWDVAYLPFSVAPVGEAAPALPPTEDPALAEAPPADPELGKIHLLLLTRMRARSRSCKNVTPTRDPLAGFACECHGGAGVTMKDRSPAELAQWRTLVAQRRATAANFRSAIGRVLFQARVEVLKKIDATYAPAEKAAAIGKTAVTDILFDLGKFAAGFREAIEKQHKAGLNTAGQQFIEELGKDDVFEYPPKEALKFLEARKNKLSDVPEEVYARIKRAAEEGYNAGDSKAQLAARVKAAFGEISDGRALTIAQTETGAVYGAGRNQAMKQAGVQWKRWLTSGNDNVRESHADANGQVVAVDEPFIVGGEELMFPGDDAGSAGNVINCHCISIADANGPEDAS